MAGTITNWMNQVRSGDHAAVDRLWEYFSPELLRRTAPQCRQLRWSDEEDIVSIAFFNLTTAMMENKSEGVTNRKEFWRLLKIITKRRLTDSIRSELSRKRGGAVEVYPIDRIPDDQLPVTAGAGNHAPGPEVSLQARLEQLAEKMHRPEFARIIECKIKGMTNTDVAKELNVSLRTVQYLIQAIKDAWLQSFDNQ